VLTSAVRTAPHWPQKFEVGEFSAPHFVQGRVSAFPQRAQKLLSAEFSDPHFEQRIEAPHAKQAPNRFCITQRQLPTTGPRSAGLRTRVSKRRRGWSGWVAGEVEHPPHRSQMKSVSRVQRRVFARQSPFPKASLAFLGTNAVEAPFLPNCEASAYPSRSRGPAY
jgi:hypothetical protein